MAVWGIKAKPAELEPHMSVEPSFPPFKRKGRGHERDTLTFAWDKNLIEFQSD